MKRADLHYLDSLAGLGIRPGLDRMRKLLRAAGNPEKAFDSILVAGTNGKGSTSAVLSSILCESGLRSGLYTSPHLVDIGERWQIERRDADDEVLHDAVERLERAARIAGLKPTYFEALTCVAFLLFEAERCDLAVLEVGMGGRLDATNVVRPIASLITPVDFDHVEFLGETITGIAAEKAGIIHRGAIVLTNNSDPAVLRVIGRRAERFGITPHIVSSDGPRSSRTQNGRTRYVERTATSEYSVNTSLVGEHQGSNVRLAIRAAEELAGRFPGIGRRVIEEGVRKARWRGRLEKFEIGEKQIWVDGAHNPAASKMVAEFKRTKLGKGGTLIFGVLDDKDVTSMTEILFPLFREVILTEPPGTPRALPVAKLVPPARRYARHFKVRRRASEALREALDGPNRERVVVCGSLYLAGHAVGWLDRRIHRNRSCD